MLLILGSVACAGPSGGPSYSESSPQASVPAEDPPSETAEPLPLALGESTSGELDAGESRDYSIELEAGQFFRILVDQQGLDVVSFLLGPERNAVLEVDAPTGERGSEEIVAVASTSGRHLLRVRAWDPRASGRYLVTLAELRPASQKDRAKAHAHGVFARANVRRWRGEIAAAVALYEEVLESFRALGDRAREADTLISLGRVYREYLHQPSHASTYYEAALPILEDLEDAERQGTVSHFLGELAADQGNLDAASNWLERARSLRERSGEPGDRASTSLQLGKVHERLGLLQEALGFFGNAIDLWRQLGERAHLAAALNNRGLVFLELGKFDQGHDDLNEALNVARELKDTRGEVWALVGISRGYRRQQDGRRALSHLQQAWELFQEIDYPRGRAILKGDFGVVYQQLGETTRARRSFEKALDLFRQLADGLAEATMLHNLGLVQSSAGSPCEALPFFRQALRTFGGVFGSAPTTHRQVSTLSEIATAERRCGDLPRAREHFERALVAIENLRSQPVSLDLRSSFFATKHRFLEAYVDLLMELHAENPSAGHDAEALAASERTRARSLLDSLMETGRDLRKGADPELIARERALGRRLAALDADPLQPADTGRATTESSTVERAAHRRSLLRELDETRARIRSESPRYAALMQPRPLTAEEIQSRVLDSETLLLEYELGDERSYLWAVTRDSVRSFSLPGRAEIESLAQRAYRLLTLSRQRSSQIRSEMVLAELGGLLLGPVAAALDGQRLLIVGDEALQYIPFGALYGPCPAEDRERCSREPLIVRHEIITMPSASAVAVLRRHLAGRRPAARPLAILADPVFQAHDPRIAQPAAGVPGAQMRTRGEVELDVSKYERLAYSGREAEEILSRFPARGPKALLSFAATREAVLEGDLGDYRVLHFATHGVLDEEHPELSRLVMSLVDENGRKRDNGFVFAHEIFNLELPAELVVLSACETALGKNVRGEGMVGLTRGFLYAGAARVIVSLWNVNDLATAKLMASFYEHLVGRGQRPAAALRAAQIELREKMPAPYYWASFVIQGEWRQIASENLSTDSENL